MRAAVLPSMLTAIGLILIPGLALAQSQSIGTDDGESVIEELVVTARYPGPAFWRVSDADSEVWILGEPTMTPKAFKWDQTRLKTVMTGANALILPPETQVGPLKLIGFLISNSKSFFYPKGQTLDKDLDPQLYQRLDRLSKLYTTDIPQDMKPAFAGLTLTGLFMGRHKLETSRIEDDVKNLARQAKVKTVLPAKYDGMPFLKAVIAMPASNQAICLEDMLNQIDGGPERVAKVTQAWSEGDSKTVVELERKTGLSRCVAGFQLGSELTSRVSQDSAKAVIQALDKPGKTVMIAEVRSLVARGGILERLAAEGYTVRTPAQ